ncbi:MAG: alpha-L-fucosidase [Victivallales bacterium]
MMSKSEWFAHDRFGMFVHWGLYSNPAGIWNGRKMKHGYSEWLQASEHIPRKEYRKLAEKFNPVGFNAEEWIREAKNAGMKYFLITAKHHDGFALWPSKASSYNVMDATPFKRDILGELAAACKKFDIKLGFYYSHWQDWEGTGGDVCSVHMENEEYVHPSQEEFGKYWRNKCLAQVRELIENYDPYFLWFDTWSDKSFSYITEAREDELISLIRKLSTKCLVNSRIQFLRPSDKVDFISTMDNSFPAEGFTKPWETSGTLNHSWAYHSMDFGWRSTRQLLQNLIGNAALGGNYQLNVGPMGDGCFQTAATRRLHEIGVWLEVNGESIYGTQASPIGKMSWGRITSRPLENNKTRLYLHLWEFTPGTALLVNGLHGTPLSAKVLESGQPVTVENGSSGTWLSLPVDLQSIDMPVIALDMQMCP